MISKCKGREENKFLSSWSTAYASLSLRPASSEAQGKEGSPSPGHAPCSTIIINLVSHPPSSLSGRSKGQGSCGLMGKWGRQHYDGVWTYQNSKGRKSARTINRRMEKLNGVHASLPSPVVWATSLVSLVRSSSHTLHKISRTWPKVNIEMKEETLHRISH